VRVGLLFVQLDYSYPRRIPQLIELNTSFIYSIIIHPVSQLSQTSFYHYSVTLTAY